MIINETDFLSYITTKKGLSAGSVKTCASRIRVLHQYLQIHHHTLSKEAIEQFLMDLIARGRNNNTLNTYIFTLRYLKDYLKNRGQSHAFLDDLTTFDKHQPLIIPLTDTEIEDILNVQLTFGSFRGRSTQFLDTMYLTLIRFIAFTGCRFEEAQSLPVERVDLNDGKAMLHGKGDHFRVTYFTDPLKGQLATLMADKQPTDLVFTNVLGKHVHATTFAKDLKERARRAGITKRVHPHLLRHSFATLEYEATRDIALVASLIGHKDIQTTYETYVHIADSIRRQGTMDNPLNQRHTSPLRRLKQIKKGLDSYQVADDPRFSEQFKGDLVKVFYEEEKRLRSQQVTDFHGQYYTHDIAEDH